MSTISLARGLGSRQRSRSRRLLGSQAAVQYAVHEHEQVGRRRRWVGAYAARRGRQQPCQLGARGGVARILQPLRHLRLRTGTHSAPAGPPSHCKCAVGMQQVLPGARCCHSA